MTDALDSLGACPIAPEAAVSEADSERPAFPRRTRFFRSVPSERTSSLGRLGVEFASEPIDRMFIAYTTT